jgi:hypothetical protein
VRGLRANLERFVFGGTDPIRLQVFRSLFALTLLVYVFDRAQTPYEWLTWDGFHVSAEFTRGFKWRPPLLPRGFVAPFLGLYMWCILLLSIGWKPRWMTWLVLAGTVYVTTADAQSAYGMNNIYMYGLLALALAPAPRTVREDGAFVERQSLWPVRVLQATLLVQYFGAGACKLLHGDWLVVDGALALNHNVLWSQVQGVYCTDLGAWMLRALPRSAWSAQQYLALVFELVGPFLFLFRRTRPLVMLWGLGFHLMIGLSMYKVGYFSAQMLTLYVLFFEPHLLRQLAERTRERLPSRGAAPA